VKFKITILLTLCITLLFFGCANMQVNDSSQDIATIDSQLLLDYNSWNIQEAMVRLQVLEKNGDISSTQAENIQQILNQRESLKNEFAPFVDAMKLHLSENDVSYLKAHVYPTLANSMMVGQINQYDMSQASFYYGKVTYNNQFAKFILVVNYADQSEYLEVTLIAANNQWWIYDVKEIN